MRYDILKIASCTILQHLVTSATVPFIAFQVPYYLGMSCTGLLYLCGKSSNASWTALVPSTLVALWGITAQSLNWAGNMRDTRPSRPSILFLISFGDGEVLILAVCWPRSPMQMEMR